MCRCEEVKQQASTKLFAKDPSTSADQRDTPSKQANSILLLHYLLFTIVVMGTVIDNI